MNNKIVGKMVVDTAKEAGDTYHIRNTPTFYVNNKMQEGDPGMQGMANLINEALAQSAKGKK